MSNTLYIAILLGSTAGCWLFAELFLYFLFSPFHKKNILGLGIQGIIPAGRSAATLELEQFVATGFLSADQLAGLVNGEAMMQQLKPEIEQHIDVFLKEKLKAAFPLLYQFMGDKTLAKFKEAFLTEVALLLPVLVNKYAGTFLQDLHPEKMLTSRLNQFSNQDIRTFFYKYLGRQIRLFRIAAIAFGLLTGLIQLLLIYWMV